MNAQFPDGRPVDDSALPPPVPPETPAQAPEPQAELVRAEPAPVLVACWRCGKAWDVAQVHCSYCRAPLVRDGPTTRPPRTPTPAASPLLRTVGVFFALLATSLVYGWIHRFGAHIPPPHDERAWHEYWTELLLVEGIDSALVLAALLWIRLPRTGGRRSWTARFVSWVVAVPLLAMVLGLNLTYAWLLRHYLDFPVFPEQERQGPGLSSWSVALVCLQPAVVEELFFRYLALGALRTVTGTAAAVLVSSVMFGMAHIFNPLGIPMLIVVGVALGAMRVASGGLLLPMVMHATHNAVVLFLAAKL